MCQVEIAGTLLPAAVDDLPCNCPFVTKEKVVILRCPSL